MATTKKFPHILIHIQVHYYFDEFYVPLFEKFADKLNFSILLDVEVDKEAQREILRRCQNFKCVREIYIFKISSGNKFLALISIKRLVKAICEIDLFIAGNLSTPEMRFLRHELNAKGIQSIWVQVSGLHHAAWQFYIDVSKTHKQSNLINRNLNKLLNYEKYPRYFRHVFKRIFRSIINFIFRYVFGLIFHRRIYRPTKFDYLPYLSGDGGTMLLIYAPDKEVVNYMFGYGSGTVITPPYLKKGQLEKEKDLLIAFPGPLDTPEELANLENFFNIIEEMCSSLQYERLLVRWHPRESQKNKIFLNNKLSERVSNNIFTDVSKQPLLETLETVCTVVGGVSNALAVARRTSSTRKVIGVTNAGLMGIMGTNTQYQKEPDIMWIETASELDQGYMKRRSFRQMYGRYSNFAEAIMEIIRKE